jgi:hypothetical protein
MEEIDWEHAEMPRSGGIFLRSSRLMRRMTELGGHHGLAWTSQHLATLGEARRAA